MSIILRKMIDKNHVEMTIYFSEIINEENFVKIFLVSLEYFKKGRIIFIRDQFSLMSVTSPMQKWRTINSGPQFKNWARGKRHHLNQYWQKGCKIFIKNQRFSVIQFKYRG